MMVALVAETSQVPQTNQVSVPCLCNGTPDWCELPTELFALVLPLLGRRDLRNVNRVNRHWRREAQTAVTHWKPHENSLHYCRGISRQFPNITEVDFEHCCECLTDAWLDQLLPHLEKLKKLTTIKLVCCNGVSDKGIKSVADTLPQLQFLSLRAWSAQSLLYCEGSWQDSTRNVSNRDPKILSALSQLKHLDLSWNPVDDEVLQNLSPLTNLTGLQVKDCVGITDEGVQHITSLCNLSFLNVSNTLISDEGLMVLCDLQLESLCLSRCSRVTDDGFYWVKRIRTVRQLDVSFCEGLTAAGLEQLGELPSLLVLHLAGCQKISPQGAKVLQELKHVEVLSLRDCVWVTDETLHILGSMLLRALNLRNCREVTNKGLKSLVCVSTLESLNLRGCENVTDFGLCILSTITTLQDLDLSYCGNISDDGVTAISSLPKLRRLILNWCRQISAEGLMALRVRRHTLTQLSIKGCHLISSTNLASITSYMCALEEIDYELCQCTVEIDLRQGGGCAVKRMPDMSRIDSVGCFQDVC